MNVVPSQRTLPSPYLDEGDGASRPPTLLDLQGRLDAVGELVAQTVPGHDGAGITLVRDGVRLNWFSNGFARAVHQAQHQVWEGPCLDAVGQARTVISGSVGAGEPRWPQFTAAARVLEVASVLSLPLVVATEVLGSINLHSRQAHAFDEAAIAVGESLARPAAASLVATARPVELVDPVPQSFDRTGATLPATLIGAIESVVAEPRDPRARAAGISKVVEEIYRATAWLLEADGDYDELRSLDHVVAAAHAHELLIGLRTSDGAR